MPGQRACGHLATGAEAVRGTALAVPCPSLRSSHACVLDDRKRLKRLARKVRQEVTVDPLLAVVAAMRLRRLLHHTSKAHAKTKSTRTTAHCSLLTA